MSLVLTDIRKHFGEVRANDGVSFEIAEGELHGLLGENGAGKSTLMKILSGFIEADGGGIELHGHTLDLKSPADSIAAGVGMLHQDPLVFLPFSVLDNFLAGRPGRLDRRHGEKELAEAAARYGFTFDPDALARSLTVGERQQLEITRLLWLGARVLILDEPTTGISESQRIKLFDVLRRLADEGMIVIFVSHKLEEIEQLCDRVTVMRRGKVVGHAEMPVPASRLVEMMFGSVHVESERPEIGLGDPVIELSNVRLEDRNLTVSDIDLTIRRREVIGLAGLEGSGQRVLLRGLSGLLPVAGGKLSIGGKPFSGRSHRQFLSAGVHYLPAGRLEEGLVAGMTLAEHFELASSRRSFFVDWGGASREASDKIGSHFIKGSPQAPAEALSGGNQQRLLLAMAPPGLTAFLMEHPTRGLDIESAEWVWSQLLRRREEGTAIIFASADLDELLRYSDRIIVFFEGRIFGTVDTVHTSSEDLGYLIGGKRPA